MQNSCDPCSAKDSLTEKFAELSVHCVGGYKYTGHLEECASCAALPGDSFLLSKGLATCGADHMQMKILWAKHYW